ncbi:hypothetical protein [Thalassotalea sp. 1_MG-2023]
MKDFCKKTHKSPKYLKSHLQ